MHDFQKELAFLGLAENLKKELRHGWLSDGRRESVAEHSWRLSLMALRYADKLQKKVNVDQCIKIALVHDLAEAITGDTPVFHLQTTQAKSAKLKAEYAGMTEIRLLLADAQGDELFRLWEEYEDQISHESKFIKALDKLEAFIQHNESDLRTWEDREKRMLFQDKWLKQYCQFDPFLAAFCQSILDTGVRKLQMAGEDLERIKRDARAEELEWVSCVQTSLAI